MFFNKRRSVNYAREDIAAAKKRKHREAYARTRNQGETRPPLSQPAVADGLSSQPSVPCEFEAGQAFVQGGGFSAESGAQVSMAAIPKEGLQNSLSNRKAACMKSPDPMKLTKYYQSGLEEDFAAFVKSWEGWIFKRARGLIRGAVSGKYELAEDVTSMVIEKVRQSASKSPWLPTKGSLSGWLYSMIRNLVVGHLRVKSNQVRTCSDFQYENDEGKLFTIEQGLYDHRTKSPQEAVISAEQLERVKGLLEQLPAETQRVVTMHYDQELTYREIAAEVGTNSTAVCRQVLAVRAQVARLGTSGPMAA